MDECPYCKDLGYMVRDDKIGTTTSIKDLLVYCLHCSVGKQLASRARRSGDEDEDQTKGAVVILVIS